MRVHWGVFVMLSSGDCFFGVLTSHPLCVF